MDFCPELIMVQDRKGAPVKPWILFGAYHICPHAYGTHKYIHTYIRTYIYIYITFMSMYAYIYIYYTHISILYVYIYIVVCVGCIYIYCLIHPYTCYCACIESCVFLLVFAVLGDVPVLMG